VGDHSDTVAAALAARRRWLSPEALAAARPTKTIRVIRDERGDAIVGLEVFET